MTESLLVPRPQARRGPAPAGLVLRPARPDDRAGLIGLLGHCSPEGLRQRFLVGIGTTPPAGVVGRLLLPHPPLGAATLALLDGQVVGHGMWASSSDEPELSVELGLLVRDDQQGRGIGSALVRVLHAQIAAAGVRTVAVTTAADNRVVAGMVARRAPGVRPEQDGPTLTYRIASDVLRAA